MWIIDRLLGRRAAKPDREAPGDGPRAPGGDAPRLSKCASNPGHGTEGRVVFTDGERSWTESFNLVRLAARVLAGRGHDLVEHESWLQLRPSGLILQPLLAEIEPLEHGGVRSVTTIDVRHAVLIPGGLFEYQHSTGDTAEEALTKGFESWESLDLEVLLDALRPKPVSCTVLEMTFPARDGTPAQTRRAVLGAVAYFATQPAPDTAEGEDEHAHPFCRCCFLTRNYEAFRFQLEAHECLGIRFYAVRGEDGTAQADCRINGEEYERGKAALRDYVATWPGSGFEFRKQYVLLQTTEASTP